MRTSTLSILGNHIIHVFLVSSNEQVLWIDTAPYVAAVQDFHSFRNFALEQFKR